MAEPDFPYDLAATLSVPDGVTRSIMVEITMEPPAATCLIYGVWHDGAYDSIEVKGSGPYNLPFLHNRIFIKFSEGAARIQVKTLGWKDISRP